MCLRGARLRIQKGVAGQRRNLGRRSTPGRGWWPSLSRCIRPGRARPCPPVEHLWSQEELEQGWRVFEAAQVIWRTEKSYDPRMSEPRKGAEGSNLGEGIADSPSPIANECAATVAGV